MLILSASPDKPFSPVFSKKRNLLGCIPAAHIFVLALVSGLGIYQTAVAQAAYNGRLDHIPSYNSSISTDRWEEDWHWVPKDAPFPLSIKSIGENDLTTAIGLDFRSRVELRNPDNFGIGNLGSAASVSNRLLASFDTHIGENLRAYVQLGTWGQTGKRHPSFFDETDLTIQRAFVDWKFSPNTMIRIGRQDLFKTSSRLLGTADALNYQPVYDAAVVRVLNKSLRLQAFVARPYFAADGYFKETDLGNASFSGLFIERGFATLPGWDFGVYGMWQERDRVLFPRRPGAERRGTLVGRVTWRTDHWSASTEAGYQFGSLGMKAISGWAFATEASFSLRSSRKAKWTLRVDGASGDSGSSGKIEAWSASAPAMAFLGRNGVNAPSNAISVFPEVSFNEGPQLRVTVGGEFTWRSDGYDAFFSAPGAMLLQPGAPGADLILAGGGVQAAYTVSSNIEVRGVAFWLTPEGAFKAAGGKPQAGATFSVIGKF